MYCTNKSQCESKRLRSEEVHCVLRKEAKCKYQSKLSLVALSLKRKEQIKLLIKIALLVVSLVCIGLYIVVK